MKKEQIYLDLSKLTQEQIEWVMSTIPKGDFNYEITGQHYYLAYWLHLEEWEVVSKEICELSTEVNFTQFQIFCDKWGYIDPIPKPLTELEKECLELLEELKTEMLETATKVNSLIKKLKCHE